MGNIHSKSLMIVVLLMRWEVRNQGRRAGIPSTNQTTFGHQCTPNQIIKTMASPAGFAVNEVCGGNSTHQVNGGLPMVRTGTRVKRTTKTNNIGK
jgi:hypothetical protein